jgi:hypothetical protein
MTSRKSGRAISAKTRALLEKAIEHHHASIKLIQEVLDQDDGNSTEELQRQWQQVWH